MKTRNFRTKEELLEALGGSIENEEEVLLHHPSGLEIHFKPWEHREARKAYNRVKRSAKRLWN